MKIKVTVHIYFNKFSWEKEGTYNFFSLKLDNTENQTWVGSQEVEFDIPENYDPRNAQIAVLEAKKTKAMADFHKTITEINDHISKLQAIEYTA